MPPEYPQGNPISPEAEARIRELQSLISGFQQRADKSKDEDIKEALNLQISKLGLKVARLRRGQPEELPSEVEKAIEDEFEPLPKPTVEQLEAADKLIQRAMLEKRRGNKQAAGDLLSQAVDVAPGASSVIEALGDDLVERNQYGAAREAYKTAHRADPTNSSVERKLAQLSMTGVANLSIEDQLRMGSFDSPFIQQGESLANPKIALILNIFVPGSGQFALGRQKKAITIFTCFLAPLVFFILVANFILPPPPVDSLGRVLPRPAGQRLPTWAYAPLVVTIGAWLAGLADVSSAVKSRSTAKPGKLDRPTPPVNLPFE